MAKRKITDAEIVTIGVLRRSGSTIEETAAALDISPTTVKRYGPKGIRHPHHNEMHRANARASQNPYLEPGGRIVNTTLGRRYR